MLAIVKTSEARRDIDEITLRIAHESVDAALRWYDELDDYFHVIARSRGVGTSRERFRKGMRSVPFGNYLIFFTKVRSAIETTRVIHGAQRWQRILRTMD